MNDERDDFLAALAVEMKKQKREQKTDDIIAFLRDHWRWFFACRRDMQSLMDDYGRQFPATVDAFCDQLGVPENVWFKRSQAMDLRQLYMSFDTSRAKQLFISCAEKARGGEACLFLVAGKSSLCLTNMQTQYEPGHMICYYKSTGDLPDIHIFKADEIPVRMPNLFIRKGE